MLRPLALALLLLVSGSPVWAEGPQFPIKKDANGNQIPSCYMQWDEGVIFNIYVSTDPAKPVTMTAPTKTMANTSPASGLTFKTECPLLPVGQYYWTVSALNADGTKESPRNAAVAFQIVDSINKPPSFSVTINISGDPALGPYAVEAVTDVPSPKVNFLVDGNPYHTESDPKYCMFGGDATCNTGVLGGGTHTVKVQVTSGTDTTVLAEATKTITELSAPPPLPAFMIGAKVKVTANLLNVRATAGGTILGVQPLNSQGTIIDGPQTAGTSGSQPLPVWWKVDFGTGVDGWVSQAYLSLVP